MPRYLVERDFPEGLNLFLEEKSTESIVSANEDIGVTWLYSYVTESQRQAYCLYEAAGPEAIRRAAHRAGLPIGVIRRVSVLEPHAYPDRAAPENGFDLRRFPR